MNPANEDTKYTIAASIREDIRQGKRLCGEKLPAAQALARERKVNERTARAAYELLIAWRLIHYNAIPPREEGYYIHTHVPLVLKQQASVFPERKELPFQLYKPHFPRTHRRLPNYVLLGEANALQHSGWLEQEIVFLQRQEVNRKRQKVKKPVELQQDIQEKAVRLLEQKGIGLPASNVLIVPQQWAMDVLIGMTLQPGDAVLIDRGSDVAAEQFFRQRGIRVCHSGADEKGMLLEGLLQRCIGQGVRLIFVRPEASAPFGYSLDESRWEALFTLAEALHIPVLAWDEHFGQWLGQPVKPLVLGHHQGRLLHVVPLSNHHAYASTLCLVMADAQVVDAVRHQLLQRKVEMDVSQLHHTMSLLNSVAWQERERQLEMRIGKNRQRQRDLINEVFGPEMVRQRVAAAGYRLWVRLPMGVEFESLLPILIRKGLYKPESNGHMTGPAYAQKIHKLGLGLVHYDPSAWGEFFELLNRYIQP
ncbi:DNA-binding transcriptional regulator, MocR family, contains an aminotransferase domain [bacterium A37T11]|nr:DNA-binding transcriptional regulator, MocR family, contains an aminotransferase domain [bacterium A37T11]